MPLNPETFTLDEIRQAYAALYQNVECMTCARLLMYLSTLIAEVERQAEEIERLQLTERAWNERFG